MKRRFFSIAFILVFAFSAFSQIPAGYYNNAEGKTGAALKTALYNIISSHTDVGYDGLYNVYTTSDNLPSGKVWDMYSIKDDGSANYFYSHNSGDRCGSYNSEGDCYNREHTFCDSWLGKASPQRSDAHHIVPTDGYVNNRRGDNPHGKVGTVSWTSSNGSKLGTSDPSTGYSGTVFEPIDEFKGDFARMYFYVVTCYENKVAGWASNGNAKEILDGTTYPAFKTWFKTLMLQWNAQDPVSQKEIDRNNAIYALQHNRNPYIDHPEYAEAVWGTGTITLNFTSSAITSSTVNQAYTYPVSVTGPTGSTFTITAPTKPDWLTLTSTGSKTATLSGTPTVTGSYDVVLSVTDGTSTKTQSFTIVVAALEGLKFTSTPTTSATAGAAYSYSVTTSDAAHTSATISLTATTKPTWLTLTDNGNGTATLSGTPTSGDAGSNALTLSATDGFTTVTQTFTITVSVASTTNTETFTDIGSASTSYSARSWTGDNGSTWTATLARTDQTLNGKAICLKKDATAYVQSGSVTGGCGSISFKVKRGFTTVETGAITLFINNNQIGLPFTYNETEQMASFSNINVVGTFVIKLLNDGGARPIIDDVVWTNYTPVPNILPTISNISTSPSSPLTGQPISVSATITDSDGSIQEAYLMWGPTSESLTNKVSMTLNGGNYEGTLPAQVSSGTIYYTINAKDNSGDTKTSDIGSISIAAENIPPSISNISINPLAPITGQDITVSASITDPDGVIEDAWLRWGTSPSTLTNQLTMSFVDNKYQVTIPSQTLTGTIYIAVHSRDDSGDETSETYSFVVTAPNVLPSISNITINPTSPLTNQSVTVSGTISDSDGTIQEAYIMWSTTSGSLTNKVSMTLNSGKYVGTIPAQATAGTIYYTVSAKDNSGETTTSDPLNYTITQNVLPSISNIAINPTNPLTNQAVTVSATITDSDGTIQEAYIMWGTTSGSLVNKVSMNLNVDKYEAIIPAQSAAGTVYFTVNAKDNSGDTKTSDQQSFAVAVPNVLPSISGLAINPTNPLTNQSVTVSATITDSDGTIQEAYIMWGTTSGSLVNKVSMSLNVDKYEGNIPAQPSTGTVYFTVSAKDNSGDTKTSDQQSFAVAVPNVLPSISNITINPTSPLTNQAVTVSATITDSEGTIQEAYIMWGTTSGSLVNKVSMSLNVDTYEGTIPAQSAAGTIFYTVSAKDNSGDTKSSDQQSFAVVAPNVLPNISGITINPTSPLTNQSVTVSATITDSDGTIQEAYIMWGTTSGSLVNKVSMSLNVDKYEGTIPAQSAAGTIFYTVSAKDNSGDTKISSEQSFAVVAPNVLPSISNITINPTSPFTNQSVTVSATITDSDGTIQEAYIMWGTTSGSMVNKVSMSLNVDKYEGIIPAQSAAGTIFFTVSAKDNSNETKTSSENNFVITAPNVAPVISAISINPANPLTGQPVTVTATITDSDGTIQEAYIMWGISSGNISNHVNMNLNGGNYEGIIPAQSQAGTIYLTINAKDNQLQTSSTPFSYSVSPITYTGYTEKESKVKIYPNPAKNQITVEAIGINAKDIVISNIIGEKVIDMPFSNNKQQIDISRLKPGVYFVLLRGDDFKNTTRIVVY